MWAGFSCDSEWEKDYFKFILFLEDRFFIFLGLFVLGVELQNDFKFLQGLGVLFHLIVGDAEACVSLMEAGIGLERLFILFNGCRVFLFEQMGIAEIFHDDRVFRIPGQGRPVGSDRIGKSSLSAGRPLPAH